MSQSQQSQNQRSHDRSASLRFWILFSLQAVQTVAVELWRLYLPSSPLTHPHCLGKLDDPYHTVMALLCYSLKLCYGLDGASRPRFAGLSACPNGSWLAWSQWVCSRDSWLHSGPLTAEQVRA